MVVEALGCQGARGEDTELYLTAEQRKQPGWIDVQNASVISLQSLGSQGNAFWVAGELQVAGQILVRCPSWANRPRERLLPTPTTYFGLR